eukprot:CAMPEP_0183713450 /NCGR_PEP_ID=MMETSP0737-20130205/8291_1 /TAXON_ID=385413 /ORGANISM="Thalassiosira miniscula, Strain CCMP1093" /LENGTH=893 /DNA_ID=CAMNT_0025942229 /DNA_START=125 /DNA_END=2806 /DNA_ORIENTATION=+
MTSSLAAIAILLSTAIISPSCHVVVAFSTPAKTSSRIMHAAVPSSSLLMAKGGTANNNKGKKRRFLQQAHPLPPPTKSSPVRSKTSTTTSSGNIGSLTGSSNRNSGAYNNNDETANNKSSSTKRGGRVAPPLQTNKSIEELETILEKRWGTATASSSSSSGKKKGGDDADFVLSFGDADDFEETMPRKSSKFKDNGVSTNNLKGAAVFRSSNRVLDPWAKEDGIYDSPPADAKSERSPVDSGEESKQQKRRRGEEINDTPSKKKRYNRQEAMLNRVRSNQERLQSKRPDREKFQREGSDDYYNVPIDVSRDYYDVDDEGYEGRRSLVAPRPAGGKGSHSKSSSSSSSSSSSLASGIFSDRSSSNEARGGNRQKQRDGRSSIRDMANDESKNRSNKRKKEPRSKPLLDENGKEMYLTLEQAEKIIEGILRSSSPSDNSINNEDDVEGAGGNEWQDIGITNPLLLSNLQSSTMSCPTPLAVQDKACPPIVSGNDVLISTHTGSGKTLAFLAPIAQTLLMNQDGGATSSSSNMAYPKAIVVAPGRELASQIVSVAQTLFEGTGLSVSLAIGGTPYSRNVERLRKRKPDLVVGTPGRIAELIIGRPGDKSGKLKISALQAIVLDEFDALLQYDAHKEPTVAIMQALDRQHSKGGSLQRVLCSATASDMMENEEGKKGISTTNIEDYLRPGYAHASVDESDLLVTSGSSSSDSNTQSTKSSSAIRVSRTTIHGQLHVPHKRLALEAVRKILNTDPMPQQALIFVDSPRRVDVVIDKLAKMDIIAAPLHGGATTNKNDRAQVSKALREGYVGIVVATEMAARGIDAPYLTHVINLDLPTDASHYAHRAGRCGRGGRPGVAVSITCDVRERGVPKRFAEELGIVMHNVEARDAKLRIVEG